MNRIVRTAAAVAALALLAGCSSLSVNYDFDSHADFAKYHTFGWMDKTLPEGAAVDAQQAELNSNLLDRRIRSAVESQLEARGIRPAVDKPDMLVTYYVGVQDKIQVSDYGYHYSPYYWGYGGRQIDVYQYQEGTLIIDLVDAETKDLVWRGSGTKVLDGSARNPDQAQERINDIVAKIMASYPPKAK